MQNKKTVALIIGHNESDGGARNDKHLVNEYQFNEPLAWMVKGLLPDKFNVEVVYRDCLYPELPAKVNATDADIAVSLHCNAFNSDPNGSEVLYYKDSAKGALLATSIQCEVVKTLGLKDRGTKPCDIDRVGKAGDRGGSLLHGTSMPCVIVEPFFIDSDSSLELAQRKYIELARAYAEGIKEYFLDEVYL